MSSTPSSRSRTFLSGHSGGYMQCYWSNAIQELGTCELVERHLPRRWTSWWLWRHYQSKRPCTLSRVARENGFNNIIYKLKLRPCDNGRALHGPTCGSIATAQAPVTHKPSSTTTSQGAMLQLCVQGENHCW